MRKINIAIDGGAASGKSVTSAAVAKQLGYKYLSTGLLYRALSYFLIQKKYESASESLLKPLLKQDLLYLIEQDAQYLPALKGQGVLSMVSLNSLEVAKISARVSAYASVRSYLFPIQKQVAAHRGVVLEGRDIGTVVLPEAELKVFLKASLSVRAQRRFQQQLPMKKKPLEEITHALQQRDLQDTQRTHSPLIPASDAYILETDTHTLDQQIARICQWAHQKITTSP